MESELLEASSGPPPRPRSKEEHQQPEEVVLVPGPAAELELGRLPDLVGCEFEEQVLEVDFPP